MVVNRRRGDSARPLRRARGPLRWAATDQARRQAARGSLAMLEGRSFAEGERGRRRGLRARVVGLGRTLLWLARR